MSGGICAIAGEICAPATLTARLTSIDSILVGRVSKFTPFQTPGMAITTSYTPFFFGIREAAKAILIKPTSTIFTSRDIRESHAKARIAVIAAVETNAFISRGPLNAAIQQQHDALHSRICGITNGQRHGRII